MSAAQSLALARHAAAGERAWCGLSNAVLGNRRKRNALAKRILANATQEHRDLYARFYGGTDYADGWKLLLSIAGAQA